MNDQSSAAVRPQSIGLVLRDLKRHGRALASTDRFLEALRVMNMAVRWAIGNRHTGKMLRRYVALFKN